MKLIVAIAAIAVMCAAALKIYRKAASALDSKGKEEGDVPQARRTAQSLVPAHDFQGHCLLTTYGECVTAFEVEGPNLSLATAEERDAQVARLAAALSGERHPYTIYRMLVPVDASAQVASIRRQLRLIEAESSDLREAAKRSGGKVAYAEEKRLRALEARRDHLERAYLPLYAEQAEAFRSMSCVVFAFEGGAEARAQAMKTTEDFMARLASAGYRTSLFGPDEMLRFLTACNGRFPSPHDRYDFDADQEA